LSTTQGKSGILVDVHSISPQRWIARTISFSGSGRMDNLLKDHRCPGPTEEVQPRLSSKSPALTSVDHIEPAGSERCLDEAEQRQLSLGLTSWSPRILARSAKRARRINRRKASRFSRISKHHETSRSRSDPERRPHPRVPKDAAPGNAAQMG